VGSAVGTAVIAYLASIHGWRITMQLIPVGGLIIILAFWKLVKEHDPDNMKIGPQVVIHTPKPKEAFKVTTPLMILIVSIALFSLGNLLSYVPLFLSEAYGETVVWAGILTSIMYAVGSAASLGGGVMSDQLDKILLMGGSHLVVGLATISLAVGSYSPVMLLLMLILYGGARYLPVPAQHALSSQVASEHPQGIGFSYTGIAIGQIFSAPVVGYLIDVLGARSAFLVCSVFPFLSGTIILGLKKTKL
jgi:predicted MFS family arabinose efflux permease